MNIYGQKIKGYLVRLYERTCVITDENEDNHLVLLSDVGMEPKPTSRYKTSESSYDELKVKSNGPIKGLRKKKGY